MIRNLLIPAASLILLQGGALNRPLLAQSKDSSVNLSSSSRQQTTRSQESRSTTSWRNTSDGVTVEVRLEGEVEFTDDDTDIKAISVDGLFAARDERGGMTRRLRVTSGADGKLQRAFSINGQAREFDLSARGWLSRLLQDAVRQGGIKPQERARRILQRKGARRLLDEISLINSDYAKRIYFDVLIRNGNPDSATLENALLQAARQLSSDYERGRFLSEFAPVYLKQEALTPFFFEAVDKITSDYEQGRVLAVALKNGLSQKALRLILKSVATFSSDYEKAQFLIQAMPLYLTDTTLRSTFLETVSAIRSDYERGRVLALMSRKTQLN